MALRWGVVGAGKISHDFAVSISTLPSLEHKIVAVASRSLGSAQEFAKEHGIEIYLDSYLELFQNQEIGWQMYCIMYISKLHI